MRLSSLLSITVVVGFAAAATVVACGGDDHAHPDSKVFMDGKVFMDAPAAGANSVGIACGSASPCPTGYSCIGAAGSAGGHGFFCTKPCVQGSGDTCAQNYTGAGFPACIFSVGSAGTVCGVICSETTAGTICPGGACTGMCPAGNTLQCTAPLKTGSGATVGSACI